jgi:hypothetical protein
MVVVWGELTVSADTRQVGLMVRVIRMSLPPKSGHLDPAHGGKLTCRIGSGHLSGLRLTHAMRAQRAES